MNSPILSDHEERLPPGVAARAASLLPSPPASSPPPPLEGPETPAPPAQRRRVIAKRYRVDELLGEGGMAVVYRGWHLPLDEPIAIKILKQEYADNEEAVTRFLQEARAGALLRGKSVAQVLDIGRLESGPPFMVTELLSGRDLQGLLEAQGRFSTGTALQLMKEICSAVSEIHQCGIVHRDLKPANIFLARDPDGEPLIKLLDFGIAKRLDGNDLNDTKNSLGSPHYMAPEQIVSAKEVAEQADIWSLGIVLFELLTGRVPFDAPTVPAQCAQVLSAPCPSPSEFVPEISEQLCAVILRCLEKEPSARYSSALELRAALEELEECQAPEVQTGPESELAVPITICLPPERDEATEPEVTWQPPPHKRRKRFVASVMVGCAALLALSFGPTRDWAKRAYGSTEEMAQRTYANATRVWASSPDRPTAPSPQPRVVAVPETRLPGPLNIAPVLPEVEPVVTPPEPKPTPPPRTLSLKAPRHATSAPVHARAAVPIRQHPDTAIEQRYALTPSPAAAKNDLINPYPDMPLK